MDGFSSLHPRFASPQLGKHGQIEGVKPRAVRVTSSPRPRDPVLPGVAGDATGREMEQRQEARRSFQLYKEEREEKKKTPNPKPSLPLEVFQDF